MDGAKWLEAVFTESEPVRPGESKRVTLRASEGFQLYSGSEGYNVLVPPDAAELTVRFQSSSAEEVDLRVHRGGSVRLEPGDSNETPRADADSGSTSPGATETVTITRASVPPLANGIYFIDLAVPQAGAQIEGTLSAEVRRSGIVAARPPALTFVSPAGSDPGPQTVRLAQETTGTARYRVVSNASWLTANPQEWARSGDGVEEISVTANTAGVAHGTHGGSLTILKAGSGQGETAWTETGVEIPVALAVVDGLGSTFTGQWANAVTIDSQPQDGDTYGAGEEIRVSVSFTDPVEVSGAPALDVRVGNRSRRAAWSGKGSRSVCEAGYKSLEFHYAVQAEDRDSDGIDIAANALTLNGGKHPDGRRCGFDSRSWGAMDRQCCESQGRRQHGDRSQGKRSRVLQQPVGRRRLQGGAKQSRSGSDSPHGSRPPEAPNWHSTWAVRRAGLRTGRAVVTGLPCSSSTRCSRKTWMRTASASGPTRSP